MDVFFTVYDWAKDRFDLSRVVKIDMEECSIRIYGPDRLIVMAEGDSKDVDTVYFEAALKLESWAKIQMGYENYNGE